MPSPEAAMIAPPLLLPPPPILFNNSSMNQATPNGLLNTSTAFALSPFKPPDHLPYQQGSNPSLFHHIMPPLPPLTGMLMNDNSSSNRKRVNGRGNGCCCFGITFCSCLWTLLLFIILLGGIALVVISQIMEKYKCIQIEYREANPVLCGQTLHDGFLYGGIVIAGLAAIILAWRIIKWLCGRRGE
ncbi:MAG: hypothetical protein EXX96DRAFT_558657 [Benjaminiella poitrasii]|nr:MAG: hypothetical protein EXX96DRAFT_558657 [Benjaminiella poitrasii]